MGTNLSLALIPANPLWCFLMATSYQNKAVTKVTTCACAQSCTRTVQLSPSVNNNIHLSVQHWCPPGALTLCLWWRLGLTVFHDGETESQERLGASQTEGEAVHPSVSCSVGRAPSFLHRHHSLLQPLIFKLRSSEEFLPGLFSSRQNFFVQLLVERKASPPPSLAWMHMDSCKDPCFDFNKIWIKSQQSLQPL